MAENFMSLRKSLVLFFLAGAEVGIDTHPSDSCWWSQALNYPHLGIGFSYENTGVLLARPGSALGSFYSLYGSLQFDMVRTRWFFLTAVIDVGLSYTPHRYHYYSNPGNVYVGSNVLADVGAGIEARFRFLPQWELALGAGLNHHSNGMTRVPNIGVNQASTRRQPAHACAIIWPRRTILTANPCLPVPIIPGDGIVFFMRRPACIVAMWNAWRWKRRRQGARRQSPTMR